jgi:hypothetical protein
MGAPLINIEDQLSIGLSSTNADLGRRYHLNDVVSWQRSPHHIRFGGDWETTRGGHTGIGDEPLTLNLFAPTSVRDFNSQQPPDSQIPLPATFLTVPDILQLPMQNFTTGIGDSFVPQAGFGRARISTLVHLFFQDTWRLHPRLVVDYGLAWTVDSPLNYDLPKPAYLEAVLGSNGLGSTRKNWKSFSPPSVSPGTVSSNGKAVIRGGANSDS